MVVVVVRLSELSLLSGCQVVVCVVKIVLVVRLLLIMTTMKTMTTMRTLRTMTTVIAKLLWPSVVIIKHPRLISWLANFFNASGVREGRVPLYHGCNHGHWN